MSNHTSALETNTSTMRAVRMHAVGQPLAVDDIPRPEPGDLDVLVEVKACGIVPNLVNVLNYFPIHRPENPIPKLPASIGLDAVGVVSAVGSKVHGVPIGQRVYVNPARYCGNCRPCRQGEPLHCQRFAFAGYFGTSPESASMLDAYPYGGLAEYTIAPHYSLVELPDSISFDAATRWGYLGTGFRALKKANVTAGDVVLVNGATGTLGVGVTLLALALGAATILATGRNRALLDKVKQIDPQRVEVYAHPDDESLEARALALTAGDGVDCIIDCSGFMADPAFVSAASGALSRGGALINIGGSTSAVPYLMHEMMQREQRIEGSSWVTTPEAREMTLLARSGRLELECMEYEVFRMDQIEEALKATQDRPSGGFTSFVIRP